MKILHVITSFPPAYGYGGPVQSSYNIAKELVERGHEVTVFTTDVYNDQSRLSNYDNPEFQGGVKIYRYKNVSNWLAWSANISSAITMWPALRARISSFDVVHLHEFRSIEAAVTAYEAQRQNVPIVLQPRGSLPRQTKCLQKQVFDRLFGSNIISRTNRIVSSSKIESSQYCKTFKQISTKNISRIPNGVNTKEYRDLPQKGSFRREHDIGQDQKLILYLGRLHKRKGIDILIRAVSDMDLDKNLCIAVIGPDDGHLSNIKSLKSTLNMANLIIPGPKYDKQKISAFNDADVFVLPSEDKYESFGNVAVEAMACGTPTVATNVCGVTEWVDHDGFFVVPPTKDGIRLGISSALNSTVDSREMRQYILSNFSWERVSVETEELYFDLTATE